MITRLTISEDKPVDLAVGDHASKVTEVLYGTTMEWAQDKTRIAQKGVIYVYSDYAKTTNWTGTEVSVPGFKVGDGTSYLVDMPFAQGALNDEIKDHLANAKIHVSDDDRERWDQSTLTLGISDETLTIS